MKIQYEVNKEKYDIFINKNLNDSLAKKIDSIKSDKKILLIYDKKIYKPLVKKNYKSSKRNWIFINSSRISRKKKK